MKISRSLRRRSNSQPIEDHNRLVLRSNVYFLFLKDFFIVSIKEGDDARNDRHNPRDPTNDERPFEFPFFVAT